MPTAATRSARFIRHRRRSHRFPIPPHPHILLTWVKNTRKGALPKSNASPCCGARQPHRLTKQACVVPTAATRSARFIRHRRRSHRFPIPPHPHILLTWVKNTRKGALPKSNASPCCGARQPHRLTKQACVVPTAATRSARFIRHRRRSHRFPIPPHPHGASLYHGAVFLSTQIGGHRRMVGNVTIQNFSGQKHHPGAGSLFIILRRPGGGVGV